MKDCSFIRDVLTPIKKGGTIPWDLDQQLLAAEKSFSQATGEHRSHRSNNPERLDDDLANFVIPFKHRAVWPAASSGFIGEKPLFSGLPQGEISVLKLMGATILTGPDNIVIPKIGTNSFDFVTENADAPDSGALGSISFSPLRIAGHFPTSKSLLRSSEQEENLSDYIFSRALIHMDYLLDAAVFGVAARSATDFQGIGYYITTGQTTKAAAVVPSWAAIQTMVQAVGDAGNLHGKPAWLTSPTGAKILQSIYKDTGTTRFLMEGGYMAGYPVFVSEGASDAAGSDTAGSLLAFGNWSNIGIRDFGLVMTKDPFSLAVYNKTLITCEYFVDVKSLQGVVDTGTTDDYEYAGFASIAIKAI